MSIEQMIANLKGAMSEIGVVIDDLEGVKTGEIEMSEVNEAYARGAVARTHCVVDAIKAARD